MRKEKRDNSFIKKPYYEGGMAAMRKFIIAHLTYPKNAKTHKIEGTVHLRYTINYKGTVVAVKIIGGIGHGCDEEAIRLIKLLKFIVPKNRNLKAVFHKTIQIHFRLPQEAVTPPPPTPPAKPAAIQYNYTTNKKPSIAAEKNKGEAGYNYTISF